MYSLTLTSDERKAFDWVGGRYSSGDIADLLIDLLPEDREWGDSQDITFLVPEHSAWTIDQLCKDDSDSGEDYCFPCFAPSLVDKMLEFCGKIV